MRQYHTSMTFSAVLTHNVLQSHISKWLKQDPGIFFYICFTFIFIIEQEDYFMSQKLMCFISKLSAILGFLWETYINLKLHHWGMLIPNINTDTSCSEQQHEKASKTCETLTICHSLYWLGLIDESCQTRSQQYCKITRSMFTPPHIVEKMCSSELHSFSWFWFDKFTDWCAIL